MQRYVSHRYIMCERHRYEFKLNTYIIQPDLTLSKVSYRHESHVKRGL